MMTKAFTILFYLFMGWVLSPILIFVVVCLLSLVDFWIVKNITGRFLLGLRWWTKIDDEGKEGWLFEYNQHTTSNSVDGTVFWASQAIVSTFWALIFLLKLFSLQPFWLLLAFFNLVLQATNLYAFYKCRKDKKDSL